MSRKNTTKDVFGDVWGRIREETPIENMVQLAKIVETSQQNVSKKKKESAFPVEWAFRVAQKYGLLTEWIMTGAGPRRLENTSTDKAQEETAPRGIIEEWVQDVREKEGNDGRIVLELSLQVPEFREWFQEKKSATPGNKGDLPQQKIA